MSNSLQLRGKTWWIRWHVPKRFKSVETRKEIFFSLKTGDEEVAQLRAATAKKRTVAMWEARLSGENPDFEAVVKYCQTLGFTYRPVAEVSDEEFIARFKAIEDVKDAATADAVLGTVKPPQMKVSGLADWYDEHTAYKRKKKNKEQNRIWKSPFNLCIKRFQEACGDMEVLTIDRKDAVKFRDNLKEMVAAGSIQADTANKSLGSIKTMMKYYLLDLAPNTANPFDGLALSAGKKQQKTRPPIPSASIQQWLRSGVLDGLNDQARDILHVVVNTGCRPSEICGLLPHHIHLNANVPHFDLVEEGRELKTAASIRKVVVVGVALEAMRRNPEGFPRYRGKHGTYSTAVNKYLRENKLTGDNGLSFYGLRHAFKDRLRAANMSDSLMDQLMGHTEKGEKYGEGYDLHRMQEALTEVSFY
ncbi:site-specific integrase [Thalassobius sp. Cn5-15]|uniref:site-specific integrase n=1 Tax=Thalassobius sp. Cn5-15 TaxID=2917763 RepID=UPI001EF34DBF|nr:site-specific integrase [Thalassobius sp. Cn5-15]MCG7492400.1 tyrosine-type recombinase/integrase [Thalassobius sp. Cn5-15]